MLFRSGEYTEPSPDESPRYRALVALVQALDARVRQWFRCAINARANHFDTLRAIYPYTETDVVPREVLYSIPMEMPVELQCPEVGGARPPSGLVIDPRGCILRPSYVSQPPSVHRFTTAPIHLSQDIGFY